MSLGFGFTVSDVLLEAAPSPSSAQSMCCATLSVLSLYLEEVEEVDAVS